MKKRVEIITTGSEILEGVYADTNSRLISEKLFVWGYDVLYHTSAPDDSRLIRCTLDIAASRVDVVIITGGLGPTEDDHNRKVISDFCNRTLIKDDKAELMLRDFFIRRGRQMPDGNLEQAFLPDQSIPIYNEVGTALSFIVRGEKTKPCIIALPGPKREFVPMLDGPVQQFLQENYPVSSSRRVLTIQTSGVPESELNQRILDMWHKDTDVRLTLLAKPNMVTFRCIAEKQTAEESETAVKEYEREFIRRIGMDNVIGYGECTLAEAVGKLFSEKGKTLAVAESCTGGMVSALLTDISGSSDYVRENYVTYSNEAKKKLLGVRKETIEKFGAVSAECAGEMAEGMRHATDCDCALSITGIAGPTGGTSEKPVGLVYFGVSDTKETKTYRRQFIGDRLAIREWACAVGLDLLRRWCL